MEATTHPGTPDFPAATEASSEMPIEGSDPDEGLICAICLDEVAMVNTAIIKGCEHIYCVNCILRWAGFKDPATCPQCKHPFSYLYVHLQLDGTLSERLLEESVVLLKRAPWFIDHVRVLEKDSGIVGSSSLLGADDYNQYDYDDDYDDDDDPYAEDEEMYLHRAGAGTRLLIGNRRWGENGRVRAGRMYARPVAPPPLAPTPAATSNRGTPASEKKVGKGAAAGRPAGPAVGSGSGSSNSRSQPATSAAGSSSSGAVSAAGIGNDSNSATAEPACPATPAATAVAPNLGAKAALGASTAAGTVATPGAPAATAGVAGSSAAAASAGAVASGSSRKNQIGRPGTRNQAASNHAAAGLAANAGSSTGAAAGGGKRQGRQAKRHNRRADADAADYDDYYH